MVLCRLLISNISMFLWHQIGQIQRAWHVFGSIWGKGYIEPQWSWSGTRHLRKQGFTHFLVLFLWEPLQSYVYEINNYLTKRQICLDKKGIIYMNYICYYQLQTFYWPKTLFCFVLFFKIIYTKRLEKLNWENWGQRNYISEREGSRILHRPQVHQAFHYIVLLHLIFRSMTEQEEIQRGLFGLGTVNF